VSGGAELDWRVAIPLHLSNRCSVFGVGVSHSGHPGSRVCGEEAAIQMIRCLDGFWRWPTTGRVSLALICRCGSIFPVLRRAEELLH